MSDPQRDRETVDRQQQQMAAAEKARDVLAAQFLSNPAVSLIDIGLGAGLAAGQAMGAGLGLAALTPASGLQPLVLRLHVKTDAAKENLHAPAEVNGFPVRVMVGDYKLE